MTRPTNPLIAQLIDELEPVRPARLAHGFAWLAAAAVVTVGAVALWQGVWRGPVQGQASAVFFLANGLVAMTGLAAGWAVLRMASPRVGARQDGSRWMLAALAILPLTAVTIGMITGGAAGRDFAAQGLHCFAAATASGMATAAALVLWLRRGAPVALQTAGFYTGVAAGAVGSAAYGLSCPLDAIEHLGIWHVAPVAVSAGIGRFFIPALIRW